MPRVSVRVDASEPSLKARHRRRCSIKRSIGITTTISCITQLYQWRQISYESKKKLSLGLSVKNDYFDCDHGAIHKPDCPQTFIFTSTLFI